MKKYTSSVCEIQDHLYQNALLGRFWRITLYFTDDAIAKLYVTKSLVK